MPGIRKWHNFILGSSLEGGFFSYLDSTVYHWHNFTLASYNRRLILIAMGASLLVFFIYALFHNYILLFLPVGAELIQPIENASSILVNTSSTTTSVAVPTAQPTQKIDLSITQSIKTIQTRRISSIIGTLASPDSISSWWVPQN